MTFIFRNITIFWDISKWNRWLKKWDGWSILFLEYYYSIILTLELYCSTIANLGFTIFWCTRFLAMKCQKCLRYDIRASVADVVKIMPFYHTKSLLYYFTTSFYNIPIIKCFIFLPLHLNIIFFIGEVRKFDEITPYTFCVRSGKEKKDELIGGGGQL